MWAHTTLHGCPNSWSGRMYDSSALLTVSSTAKLDRARSPYCGYLQFIYSSVAFGNGSLPLKFGQVWNCRVIKLARRRESPLKRRLAASQVTLAEGSGAETITIFISIRLFWNHASSSRLRSWAVQPSTPVKTAEKVMKQKWQKLFCGKWHFAEFRFRIQFAGFH